MGIGIVQVLVSSSLVPKGFCLSNVAFEAKFLHNATKGRLRNDKTHVLDEGNEVWWCYMSMITKRSTHKCEVILGEPRRTSETREWQIGFGMCSYISTNSALAAPKDAADCTVRVGCSSLCNLASLDQCESRITLVMGWDVDKLKGCSCRCRRGLQDVNNGNCQQQITLG